MENELCQKETTVNQLKISEKLIENVLNDSTNDIKNEFDDKTLNDTTKISGIYKIINKIDGKYYVGSSENIIRRWYIHQRSLNFGLHHSFKLQHAWNKYGKDYFELIIVEKVNNENLLPAEQLYLNECKCNPDKNYNVSYIAGSPFKGKTHTDETKNKISIKNKGLIRSDMFRLNARNFMTGRKLSESHKNAMRVKKKPHLRKKLSEEQYKLIGLNRRGIKYKTKKVVIDGIEYTSIKAASETLNVCRSLIYYWIKSGKHTVKLENEV